MGSFNPALDRELSTFVGHHYSRPDHRIIKGHINKQEMGVVHAACDRWGRGWQYSGPECAELREIKE